MVSNSVEMLQEDIEKAERIKRRRELVARGPRLMEEKCKAMGIPWPPDVPPLSDEELKEAAFLEQFGEDWLHC